MHPENFKTILYKKDEATGIVWVTLNSPATKNAMTFLTFAELCEAVDLFAQDEKALAMILTGAVNPKIDDPAKQAFSSGGYFNPTKGPLTDGAEENGAAEALEIDISDIAQIRLTLKLWECEKPVVAAINGLAVGAGLTMPVACADLIVASEYAWAQLPFVRIGIVPEFASTFLLPRLLGFQRAKELLFFGDRLTAEQMLAMGLINKVTPHEKLLETAQDMALGLIPPKGAGWAVKMTKRALHQPLIEALRAHLELENDGLNKSVDTEDFKEAILSRMEKRAPVFKGA